MDTCSVNPYSALSWTAEMLQDYANKFTSAYANNQEYRGDIQWIFSKITEAVIFMASDLRAITYFGADFKNLDSKDTLEAWIIEHVFPRLESNNWPSPGTKAFMECMHELKTGIMNADPAVIALRNQLSRSSPTLGM